MLKLNLIYYLFITIVLCFVSKNNIHLHALDDYNSNGIDIEPCITSFNTNGKCLHLYDCPNYKSIIREPVKPKICYWSGEIPIICCPSSSNSGNITMTTKTISTGIYPSIIQNTTLSTLSYPPFNLTTIANKWKKLRQPSSSYKKRKIMTTTPPSETTSTIQPSPEPEPIKEVFIETRSAITNCGTRRTNSKSNSRIVGGIVAYDNEFPWNAAIFMKDPGGSLNHECGGSIISDQYILTAAHCFVSVNPSYFIIGIGNNDIRNTIKLQVESILLHPEFDHHQFYNDIALVKTKEKINFTDSIRPICLPDKYDLIEDNLIVSGWGYTDFNGETSDQLLKADLKLVNREECNQTFYSLRSTRISKGITEHFLCAGTENGSKDACQNDSGGSLIAKAAPIDHTKDWESRFIQIGIVSFGFKCGVRGFPGVYTNIFLYTKWLKDNVPFAKSNTPYLGPVTRRDRIG